MYKLQIFHCCCNAGNCVWQLLWFVQFMTSNLLRQFRGFVRELHKIIEIVYENLNSYVKSIF